jgi:nitroimidazol reductase NimA-like FMN-containing flavoprotein (pyridoxamine 5'-phosphate oxidase superfamily)
MAMTHDERKQFLGKTRLGIVTTIDERGDPTAVPVWYEWDGLVVRFSPSPAPKVARLRRRPRASCSRRQRRERTRGVGARSMAML